jgi:hypothetical protein
MSAPQPAKPLVTVSVFLFGKPAWEIDRLEGGDVDAELLDEVSACGEELFRRLTRAAQIGRKLLEGGWEGCGLLYDIDFYKEIPLKDAGQELDEMGIGRDEVSVMEEAPEESDGETYVE